MTFEEFKARIKRIYPTADVYVRPVSSPERKIVRIITAQGDTTVNLELYSELIYQTSRGLNLPELVAEHIAGIFQGGNPYIEIRLDELRAVIPVRLIGV